MGYYLPLDFLFSWYCTTLKDQMGVFSRARCTECSFRSISSFIVTFLQRTEMSLVRVSPGPSFPAPVFDFDLPGHSQRVSLLQVMCEHFSLLLKTILGLPWPSVDSELLGPRNLVLTSCLLLISSASSPSSLYTLPGNLSYFWNPGHTAPSHLHSSA